MPCTLTRDGRERGKACALTYGVVIALAPMAAGFVTWEHSQARAGISKGHQRGFFVVTVSFVLSLASSLGVGQILLFCNVGQILLFCNVGQILLFCKRWCLLMTIGHSLGTGRALCTFFGTGL